MATYTLTMRKIRVRNGEPFMIQASKRFVSIDRIEDFRRKFEKAGFRQKDATGSLAAGGKEGPLVVKKFDFEALKKICK